MEGNSTHGWNSPVWYTVSHNLESYNIWKTLHTPSHGCMILDCILPLEYPQHLLCPSWSKLLDMLQVSQNSYSLHNTHHNLILEIKIIIMLII